MSEPPPPPLPVVRILLLFVVFRLYWPLFWPLGMERPYFKPSWAFEQLIAYQRDGFRPPADPNYLFLRPAKQLDRAGRIQEGLSFLLCLQRGLLSWEGIKSYAKSSTN